MNDSLYQSEDAFARDVAPRYSGVLLHPTSLPGGHGIGDLGPAAFAFVDWLERAGQSRWQILPLTPPGSGASPYQSFSAFAGNPLLISLERLHEEGLLAADDLTSVDFPADHVDFGWAEEFKQQRLRRAAEHFFGAAGEPLQADFAAFKAEHSHWLDDYALFMALKAEHQAIWLDWPALERDRDASALASARLRLADDVRFREFVQFVFFRQWRALRNYANLHGVRMVGDIPIFVALDSADVWANPRIFQLGPKGKPAAVAGVPPDYFSAKGQLWGNPLYDWDALADTGYAWWIARFRTMFSLVDIARVDHFRGFAAYWSVPAGEKTAINGHWELGPGRALFDAVQAELGELAIIAEDLGLITADVDELRRSLGFPGMAVLQFAFDSDASNLYLPHNIERLSVVYPGTHDNDTSAGWYAEAEEHTRDHLRRYLEVSGDDPAWDLIRTAWRSVAETAICQLQDLLALPTEARMNTPGSADGNWGWRVQGDQLTDDLADQLAALTTLYGRTG